MKVGSFIIFVVLGIACKRAFAMNPYCKETGNPMGCHVICPPKTMQPGCIECKPKYSSSTCCQKKTYCPSTSTSTSSSTSTSISASTSTLTSTSASTLTSASTPTTTMTATQTPTASVGPAESSSSVSPTVQPPSTAGPTTAGNVCPWSEWGSWSKCNCRTGTQARTRDITKLSQSGCTISGCAQDTRGCIRKECPVDCIYTNWSSWSKCKSDGKRSRKRAIRVPALYGGKKCEKFLEEKRCKRDDFVRHVDVGDFGGCDFGSWSSWSDCRPNIRCDCHGGSRFYDVDGFRSREKHGRGGRRCSDRKEKRSCRAKCC